MAIVKVPGGGVVGYHGVGAGPPLILLPGLPCRARHMRRLAAALSSSFSVLSIDLPGFGESSRVEATKEAFARRILAGVRALGHDTLTVMGHSMGAVVAAEVAHQAGDRVQELALLACIGCRPHDSLRNSGIPFRDLTERFDGPGREAALDEAEAHFRRIGARGMRRDEAEQAIRFVHYLDFAAVPELLHGLTVPTMMAFADDDASIEPEIRRVLQAWAPPGRVLRFPTGGHGVHVTRAQEIAEGFLDWRYGEASSAATG